MDQNNSDILRYVVHNDLALQLPPGWEDTSILCISRQINGKPCSIVISTKIGDVSDDALEVARSAIKGLETSFGELEFEMLTEPTELFAKSAIITFKYRTPPHKRTYNNCAQLIFSRQERTFVMTLTCSDIDASLLEEDLLNVVYSLKIISDQEL